MPIALSCPCGRALNVKDALAGKRIRCPACQDILTVPEPENDLALEVLPADEAPRSRRAAIQAEPPEPMRRRERDEEDDDVPQVRRRSKVSREIKRRSAVKRSRPLVTFEQGWFGNVNSGVVGGFLMMLIAVVWFVLGLAGGYIFFYPPILFVVGIIAVVKGGLGDS